MPPPPIGSRGKVLALVLAALVYIPLFHNAVLGSPPFVPWRINEFWRITQLFPRRTMVWPVHQVFVAGPDGVWQQVPQTPVFRHNLFGRMTRMDMLQLMVGFRRTDDPLTRDMKNRIFTKVCRAFAKAYDNRNGEAARMLTAEGYGPIPTPVSAVRLVTVWLPVAFESKPTRRWSPWPPVDYSDLEPETTFEWRRR